MNRKSWSSTTPGPIQLSGKKPSDAADVAQSKIHAVPKAALEEGILQLLASAAEMQQRRDFDSALQLYGAAIDKVKAHNLNRKRLFTGTSKKPPPLNSKTPLEWSLHSGDIASAICLVGSPNAALTELRSKVTLAQIEQVLDAGASIEHRLGPVGRTLLLQEAAEGRLAGVQLALNRGARVEVMDDNGDTALALALQSQNAQSTLIVIDLLEAGADLHSCDGRGQPLFKLSIAQAQPEVVKEIMSRLTPLTPEQSECMRSLAASFPVLGEKWDDRTCGVLRLLLSHGLDPNLRLQPDGHCTLLEAALQRKGVSSELLVADLLHYGAVASLEAALRSGTSQFVELILARFTPLQETELDQTRAWVKTLHFNPQRWSSRSLEILRLLLEHGFDPDYRRPEAPHSPLIVCAAKSGDLALIQTLIARKAQLNVTDDHSGTALIYAAETHNRPIYDALKKAGVNDGLFFGITSVWHSHNR